MIKYLTFLILSSPLWARPLEQMQSRLETYNQQNQHCAPALPTVVPVSDSGLLTQISCSIHCENKKESKQKLEASFLPAELGLTPGDGSSQRNTIWRTLTVSLKSWSEELCLEEAVRQCQSLTQVKAVKVHEIASGQWKLNHFPGCQEKTITPSPFDDRQGALRLNQIAQPILSSTQLSSPRHELLTKIHALAKNSKITKCSKKITGQVCYGDCVDINAKETVETLGTPEPLGSSEIVICGDELNSLYKDYTLSKAVKGQLCEGFFWQAVKNRQITGSSCAALRGTVDCSSLL
jgi:hypothetical protein